MTRDIFKRRFLKVNFWLAGDTLNSENSKGIFFIP